MKKLTLLTATLAATLLFLPTIASAASRDRNGRDHDRSIAITDGYMGGGYKRREPPRRPGYDRPKPKPKPSPNPGYGRPNPRPGKPDPGYGHNTRPGKPGPGRPGGDATTRPVKPKPDRNRRNR
jgi:hypothetical protein